MAARDSRFDHWSTGTKLLVLLTVILLPLGLALAWTARATLRDSNAALARNAREEGRIAARTIESLIARHALALKVAASGALRENPSDPCTATRQSLALTPGIATRFSVRDMAGKVICTVGGFSPGREDIAANPGDIKLWVSPHTQSIVYRVGVVGGTATAEVTVPEIADGIRDLTLNVRTVRILDAFARLDVISAPAGAAGGLRHYQFPVGNAQVTIDAGVPVQRAYLFDRMTILLPILMWLAAAILTWFMVRRLLLLPLGRLQRAVTDYRPGDDRLVLPERLGSAEEIRTLGKAFERAVDRIEESENQMAEALAGQRRLVREVHHRVKNNLQVIASLLNIHGRSASTPESAAAYAAIGRRVDSLSVVHRNHFAEVEESRGIALRPMLVELSTILRGSTPDKDRPVNIQIDVDDLHTTQDAAVAVAFFVTEVVEFVMLRAPGQSVDIDLRRMSELAASLSVSSTTLVGDDKEGEARQRERQQFERVIGGLARQLRSPLESKLGRLSVVLPVFPDLR